jgi:HD-like signal output (HDOD) protein/CheY-like chemotaxis protein
MAADTRPRALIVDDEKIVRRLIAKTLADEGFFCDLAADGEEASKLISARSYEILITDLRMPNRHGHALILEALGLSPRPAIIVLTSVREPKIVRDLLSRGVDEFIFKPADSATIAVTATMLVEKRRRLAAVPASDSTPELEFASGGGPSDELAAERHDIRLDAEQLAAKLSQISSILPISPAAVDLYQMTRNCDLEIAEIAAAIQRDPSLAADVLRLANSAYYNPSSKGIVNLDDAIMSIGQTRIGEMSLSLNALSSAAHTALPWMNLDLAWRRGIAASSAIEHLVAIGGHEGIKDGLALSAAMFPLGRVVLGALFPDVYGRFAANCAAHRSTMKQCERELFPMSHASALSQLLASWNIPTDVTLPLKHAADEYAVTGHLVDPLRSKVGLLKLAILVGRIAVGVWESWDFIELPTSSVLEHLKTPIIDDLVSRIRGDMARLTGFQPGAGAASAELDPAASVRTVAYCSIPGATTDLLAELLPALGYQLDRVRVEHLRDVDEPVIINGIDAPAIRYAAHRVRDGRGALAIVTSEKVDSYAKLARAVALPCSFAALRAAINDLLSDFKTNAKTRGSFDAAPHSTLVGA